MYVRTDKRTTDQLLYEINIRFFLKKKANIIIIKKFGKFTILELV